MTDLDYVAEAVERARWKAMEAADWRDDNPVAQALFILHEEMTKAVHQRNVTRDAPEV